MPLLQALSDFGIGAKLDAAIIEQEMAAIDMVAQVRKPGWVAGGLIDQIGRERDACGGQE